MKTVRKGSKLGAEDRGGRNDRSCMKGKSYLKHPKKEGTPFIHKSREVVKHKELKRRDTKHEKTKKVSIKSRLEKDSKGTSSCNPGRIGSVRTPSGPDEEVVEEEAATAGAEARLRASLIKGRLIFVSRVTKLVGILVVASHLRFAIPATH